MKPKTKRVNSDGVFGQLVVLLERGDVRELCSVLVRVPAAVRTCARSSSQFELCSDRLVHIRLRSSRLRPAAITALFEFGRGLRIIIFPCNRRCRNNCIRCFVSNFAGACNVRGKKSREVLVSSTGQFNSSHAIAFCSCFTMVIQDHHRRILMRLSLIVSLCLAVLVLIGLFVMFGLTLL